MIKNRTEIFNGFENIREAQFQISFQPLCLQIVSWLFKSSSHNRFCSCFWWRGGYRFGWVSGFGCGESLASLNEPVTVSFAHQTWSTTTQESTRYAAYFSFFGIVVTPKEVSNSLTATVRTIFVLRAPLESKFRASQSSDNEAKRQCKSQLHVECVSSMRKRRS